MIPKTIINVEIEFFDNIDLPENQRFIASIREGIYKGTIVVAGSMSECFKELSVSMFVLEDYRKNKPSTP